MTQMTDSELITFLVGFMLGFSCTPVAMVILYFIGKRIDRAEKEIE